MGVISCLFYTIKQSTEFKTLFTIKKNKQKLKNGREDLVITSVPTLTAKQYYKEEGAETELNYWKTWLLWFCFCFCL